MVDVKGRAVKGFRVTNFEYQKRQSIATALFPMDNIACVFYHPHRIAGIALVQTVVATHPTHIQSLSCLREKSPLFVLN